jgi:hypothetical protein
MHCKVPNISCTFIKPIIVHIMKITSLISIMSLLFLSLSCKKNNSTASPAANSNNSNPPPPIPLYDGRINTLHTNPIGGNPNTFYSCNANFFSTSIDITNPPMYTDVNVGSVSINNKILKKLNAPSGITYQDTTNQISGPSFSLTASGTGSINSFNLSFNQSYPALGNTAQVPSVITRSAGLTFTLTNIVNTDSIQLNILSPNSSGLVKSKTVVNGSVVFNFTPSELQNALSPTSQNGSIRLALMKTNTVISTTSKNYLFYTEEYYTKSGLPIQ